MNKKIFKVIAIKISNLIPDTFLLWGLKRLKSMPMFGQRMIAFFDPNSIRKYTSIRKKDNIKTIEGTNWKLKINVRDHIGYRSYINSKPFEMSVYNTGYKLLGNGRSIILDIGANIGSASIPLCSEQGLTLIAVEASKRTASLLCQNICENNIQSQLFLNALFSEASGKYFDLYINDGNTGANSLNMSWNRSINIEQSSVEKVPVSTLDRVIDQSGIDISEILLTKIDVEGAEEEVLMGATEFLKHNDAPIIMEYRSDATLKYLNKSLSPLVQILTDTNYTIYALNSNGTIAEFHENNSYENIIAVKDPDDVTKLY